MAIAKNVSGNTLLKNSKDSKNDLLSKFIGYCSVFLFFLIILLKSIYPYSLIKRVFNNNFLPLFSAIITCALTLFLIFFFDSIIYKFNFFINFINIIKKTNFKKLLFTLICLSLIAKLLGIFLFNIQSYSTHPDMKGYVDNSYQLITKGKVDDPILWSMAFPHVFWFSVFLTPVECIFGKSQIAISIYLTIISTITICLFFVTAAHKFNKNKAFAAMLVYSMSPSQILNVQYTTHEHAMIFFLSISCLLYFKIIPLAKTKLLKAVFFFAFLLSMFLGSLVNGSTLIAYIAFLILFLIRALRDKNKYSVAIQSLKCFILITSLIIGNIASTGIHSGLIESKTNIMGYRNTVWTLYIGTDIGIDKEFKKVRTPEWNNYPETFTQEEVERYHTDLLLKRYKEIISKPGYVFNVLCLKFATIWNSYNFSIGYTNETIPNENIQNFYNRFLFKPLFLIEYIIEYFVAVLGFIYIFRSRKKVKSLYFVWLELFVLGSTSMLMLTECANKYAFVIRPIFLLLCFSIIKINPKIKLKKSYK